MDRRIWMFVLLLSVCYSHDAGVNAQPEVIAWILTPEADRKEGGQVDMRCIATNLESGHIVEWRTGNKTLRRDEMTLTNNERFMFNTEAGPQVTIQELSITNLRRDDSADYVCNVNEATPTGGVSIVATTRVTLSVMRIPTVSNPIGSTTDRRPSSSYNVWIEAKFKVAIVLFAVFFIFTIILILQVIKLMHFNNRLIKQLTETQPRVPGGDPYMELQPTDDKNTVYMEPTVKQTNTTQDTYYQAVEVENDSPEYDYAQPEDNTDSSYEAVGIGGERQKRLIQSFTEEVPQVPKADPYMELQPRDETRVCMEPTVKETTTIEHTYFKPVEVEIESLEYDSARPEGNTDTSYETVQVPQNGERQ